MIDVQSYTFDRWTPPGAAARTIASAITGQPIARAGGPVDAPAILAHARMVGGPALRAMTFHDRARMLKALATHLNERKRVLYDLSYDTGATLGDHPFDIDGGIGTLFVYASKGRRELPDDVLYVEGSLEPLGRTGTFAGQHVATSLQGAAVHINAFNFPVWGMLEKLAPTLLAGVPAIVKPATASCYVTEACVRLLLETGLLPDGALQLISGSVGDMLDHMGPQDVLSFTGSAETGLMLRAHPRLLANATRFVAEQDSLNASILGPDVGLDSAEFDLFVKEAAREITTKAGQKCTAIRRILAPEPMIGALIEALSARLARTTIGDPRLPETRMGPLISTAQRTDVLEKAAAIGTEAQRVHGDPDRFEVTGADRNAGAFLPPMLFHCADPDGARHVHDTEAFGPVSTVMAYRDLDHALALANRGQGSLVASVITRDGAVARRAVLAAGAWHGRLYFNNADSMAEATGHGAPMPHLIHGGPGRAGGGEEQGGIRGVLSYMQRTAVQGSPDLLSAVTGAWVPGAAQPEATSHPFTRPYGDLVLGETLVTEARDITLDDIEHFARFTGDTFYAHMDEEAAAANPFFPGRVAHGYLLLSFAAGLFVQPDPGPVLANTGLEDLRFMKPVQAGARIHVRLTVKAKKPRATSYGEVRWHVVIMDEDGDAVATYTLLTMNAL